jgi:hypothetical protein
MRLPKDTNPHRTDADPGRTDKSSYTRRARMLLGAIAATALLVAAATPIAGAASPIEGIWSFNGGKVAIQSQVGGTFIGTVVAPTKFAQCPHPIGEPMWTSLRPQADGSYWGLHQWYFESCAPNPTLGPTAWRVIETANRSHFLRVCFGSPGSSQPTIAPIGSGANVSYGCADSALIAPLPTDTSSALRLKRSVKLPSSRKCFSQRAFRIHLSDPKNDPLKEVVIRIRNRKITVVRHAGAIVARISLKGLPRGAFTIRIHAVTVLGHHLSSKRTYHTCIKKIARRHKSKSHRRK